MPRSTTCLRCRRHLKNPASIEVGMGPTCARKAGVHHGGGGTGEPLYFQSGSCAATWVDFAENVPGDSYVAFPKPGDTRPIATICAAHVHVSDEGQVTARFLDPGLDLENRSPTGFQYGYGGSGPSQLAFAILLDYYGRAAPGTWNARLAYQDFKREFLARSSPPQPLVIPRRDIDAWLKEREVAAK